MYDSAGQILKDSAGEVMTYTLTGLDAINQSLSTTILPNMTSELAYYAVNKVGELLGVDSRLSQLVGIGIRSSLQAGLNGGNLADIWGSVMKGVTQGALNIGIEYVGQALKIDPIYTALAARAISGALEGLVTPINSDDPEAAKKGALRGAIEGIFDSGKNFLILGGTATGNDSWGQTAYIAQVLDISKSIQEQGLAETLNTYATGILQQDAISSIIKTGLTISEYVNQKKGDNDVEEVVASDGGAAMLMELGDEGAYLVYRENEAGEDELLVVKDGNSYREADIGPDGKPDWTKYTEVLQHWDGSTSVTRVEDGQVVSSDIYTIDGGSYTAYGTSEYKLVSNGDSYSATVLESGIVKDNLTGDESYFKDGIKVKDKFVTGSFTIKQDTEGNVHVYALRDVEGNGAGYFELNYNSEGTIIGGSYKSNPSLLNNTVEITDPIEKAKIVQDANRLVQPDNPNPPDDHLNMGMGAPGNQFYEGMVQIGAIVPGIGNAGRAVAGPGGLVLTGSYYNSTGVNVPVVVKGSKQTGDDDPWWKQTWNKWFNKSPKYSPSPARDNQVEATIKDEVLYRYSNKNDSHISKDGRVEEGTYLTPEKYSSAKEAKDKLDAFAEIKGYWKILVKKGTIVKRGTVPGGENGGAGGGREIILDDSLTNAAAWEFVPFDD